MKGRLLVLATLLCHRRKHWRRCGVTGACIELRSCPSFHRREQALQHCTCHLEEVSMLWKCALSPCAWRLCDGIAKPSRPADTTTSQCAGIHVIQKQHDGRTGGDKL